MNRDIPCLFCHERFPYIIDATRHMIVEHNLKSVAIPRDEDDRREQRYDELSRRHR